MEVQLKILKITLLHTQMMLFALSVKLRSPARSSIAMLADSTLDITTNEIIHV